ncbi:hypothetical protein YC2023_015719 [Brassica napus]
MHLLVLIGCFSMLFVGSRRICVSVGFIDGDRAFPRWLSSNRKDRQRNKTNEPQSRGVHLDCEHQCHGLTDCRHKSHNSPNDQTQVPSSYFTKRSNTSSISSSLSQALKFFI